MRAFIKTVIAATVFMILLTGVSLAQTATITLRPQYVDLSSATAEGAVLVTAAGYSGNDARYRLYNGSNQHNC